MLKVLVTGATGFAGSHALEALMEVENIKLIAAVRNPRKLVTGFKGEIRRGDLRDKAFVERLMDGVDVVVHAAAWSSLYKHRKQSAAHFYVPSINVVDAAKQAGVRKFINISTASAAAPDQSSDANMRGIQRHFWPHLANAVRIEDHLYQEANDKFNVINLRLGLFVGKRYALGLLPILLPRLKTHLVPWVNGGKTSMPLIDGRDIGQAIKRAVVTSQSNNRSFDVFEGFNIAGPEIPTVREVMAFLKTEYGYPTPHFSVPFFIAYPFAGLMELLDPLLPFEPLVTRSIIHLLEETNISNDKAKKLLGYSPQYMWQDAIRAQLIEMQTRQVRPMSMARPIHD